MQVYVQTDTDIEINKDTNIDAGIGVDRYRYGNR